MRGLDYYTRTAWEWTGAGLSTSISGGGRYDGLAEQIGGPPTPGVGFGAGSSGCSRWCGRSPEQRSGLVLFAVIAESAQPRLFALMDEARAAGVAADAGLWIAPPQAAAGDGLQAGSADGGDRGRG